MDNGVKITIGLISAALAGGLITGLISYSKSQRARRRRIIAEAVEVALDRVEILYKLRRRASDTTLRGQDELDIRNEMHRIQSKTEYYTTIISSESAWLGSCYEKFVNEIKRQVEPLIQEAWEQKPLGIGIALKDTKHPNLKGAREEFILEIQRYFNPLRRLIFASIFRLWRTIYREQSR